MQLLELLTQGGERALVKVLSMNFLLVLLQISIISMYRASSAMSQPELWLSWFPLNQHAPPPSCTREYFGYLTTDRDAYQTMYTYINSSPDVIGSCNGNDDGALFHHTATDCNGFPCPPYEATCMLSWAVYTYLAASLSRTELLLERIIITIVYQHLFLNQNLIGCSMIVSGQLMIIVVLHAWSKIKVNFDVQCE